MAKCIKFLNKIFDYIHITRYKLFFLAWYNNLIFAQSKKSTQKTLAIFSCNSLSYKFMKSDYIN